VRSAPAPALVDPAWLHTLSAWSSVTIDHVRTAVAQWGPWAPVTSILITVINTFLPFPTDLMIVADGIVFGFWDGLLVPVIGAIRRRLARVMKIPTNLAGAPFPSGQLPA
jgi:hypothetical protein